ncbi:MAG TPA: hypothetical protein VJ957_10180 [Longimicrobiales bacterium]|nr:hypothetical protein [Longimicrobiales bacterium]
MLRPVARALLALSVLWAGCRDGGPTQPASPPAATTITAISPRSVQEFPGQALPMRVRVEDADGNGVAGVPVTFQLVAGADGWLTEQADRKTVLDTTGADGVAETIWTLAQANGVDSLYATACGDSVPAAGCATPLAGSPLVFTATVDAFTDWAAVAAGRNYTCGRTRHAAAYCWGNGASGQLGAGTTASARVPVGVLGAHAWSDVAAGWYTACGLAADSAAYCWGLGNAGQLGDGWSFGSLLPYSEPAPVRVAGTHAWAAVFGGADHNCAITTAGTAYCWGLGLGSSPHLVGDTLSWASLAPGARRTCGVTTTGDAYCWNYAHAPALVPGGYAWATLGVGADHACGVTVDGVALCWGSGESGELGNGSSGPGTELSVPVPVWGDHAWASLSVGGHHTCALTTAGEAYCWGVGADGQLGTGYLGAGYFEPRPAPVAGRRIWTQISAGYRHTCGVTADGEAYCWGSDDDGRLGRGFQNQQATRATPVRVADPR